MMLPGSVISIMTGLLNSYVPWRERNFSMGRLLKVVHPAWRNILKGLVHFFVMNDFYTVVYNTM